MILKFCELHLDLREFRLRFARRLLCLSRGKARVAAVGLAFANALSKLIAQRADLAPAVVPLPPQKEGDENECDRRGRNAPRFALRSPLRIVFHARTD